MLESDSDHPELYRGVKLLHDPVRNKGTAFSDAERDALGLHGLLPPRVHAIGEQELRVLGEIRNKSSDLERYLFLVSLQDRNETLFFHVITHHMEEMMPLIYTPTVGKACQEFGHIFRRPRGMYLSIRDRGRIRSILENWPHRDARIIVVSDGERILGLGDLGASGMGIPIGKLALYTACAGICPTQCLPVMLDVGTNNEALLNDPLYIGLEQRRVRGEAYDELVDEFISAANEVFPGVLIQLEDFGNANAFRLLAHYRDQVCLFDDDIQGTGAVVLAGLMNAVRLTGSTLSEQRLLFLGAGEAGIGIADIVVAELVSGGMPEAEARTHCWFVDTQGLLVADRREIPDSKHAYAHPHAPLNDLVDAIRQLKPTALIGISAQPEAFTRPVIEAMAELNPRPIVFALSNPTSKAECTAEQAYGWSRGQAVFASGSPFEPVAFEGRTLVPGQGNNAYIFPGVGLGVVVSGARRVTTGMFLASAHALASQTLEEDLAQGRVYPPLSRIREISAAIAAEVARVAYRENLADGNEPDHLPSVIQAAMYQPVYPDYDLVDRAPAPH